MKNIKIEFKEDGINNDICLSLSGKDLVFNVQNFFDINSIMTFVPKELIGDLAIQLTQLAEDIQRTKDLGDGKAGEELREMSALEKEAE